MKQIKVLNQEQRAAITHGEGPLLIIAGAGTGKTTVVTERIKHLIIEKNIHPSNILALTFTEKAASEMEERIDVAMPYGYTQLWISTFHAFCDRILRNEAIHIGLNPGYTLATEAEIILFLRKNIFKFELEYFRPLGNPTKFLTGMLTHFNRLKDEDISPDEYLDYAQNLNKNRSSIDIDEGEIKKTFELAYAFKKFEQLKDSEGIMDFSDLIANTLKLFRKRLNVLKQYQNQFKYILVDEFQDTNYAQNQLAILLAGERKNITIVGDDDQAIYRWRGAAISNMVQFKDQFPEAKVITLTKNYRSTRTILDCSYDVIQYNNPDRLEAKEEINKKLNSMREIKGNPITFLFAPAVEDEAEQVVNTIVALVTKKKIPYKDIAILVRANDHSQPFVKTLQRKGIPYQFLGPGQLFHQEEIKDLIAYLKVLYNFEDDASLYRLLNLSVLQIDARDVAAFLNFSKRKNMHLFITLEKIADGSIDINELFLKETTKKRIIHIVDLIHRHLKIVSKVSAGQILYYFLQDSGMLKHYLEPKTEKEEREFQNIARFFEKLKTYEAEHEDASIFSVVDWIDLSMQMGESPLASNSDWSKNNAVNILTIHSSKGLEFPVVFLVNLVSARFPTRERREQIPIPQELIKEILPEGDYHLQEERRLFYVGMTRAKDFLYISAAHFYGEGKRERKISPFVYEALGQKYVETIIQAEKETKTTNQLSLLEWSQIETLEQKPFDQLKTMNSLLSTPLTYLSFSQIQTFDVCPLHYKLKYLLKIPTPTTSALSFGVSIHSALKIYFQKVMNKENVNPKDVKAILQSCWVDEGYTSSTHEKEAITQAEQILLRYLEKNYDPIHTKPLALELPFQFFIKDQTVRPQPLKLGGRIDRIDLLSDGRIEIMDYKTGINIPNHEDVDANIQLSIYALAATEIKDPLLNRNPQDIILTLHYLETDTKLTTARTKEQLEACKTKILQKAQEIEKSSFECSGGILCQNCEYKILCSTASA